MDLKQRKRKIMKVIKKIEECQNKEKEIEKEKVKEKD